MPREGRGASTGAAAAISFCRQNQKRPGSAAHDRYERYKSARTLQRALDLGACRADLRWDFQAGFLTIAGIAARGTKRPLELPLARRRGGPPHGRKVRAVPAAAAAKHKGKFRGQKVSKSVLAKGVYRDGKYYKAVYFFYFFGIVAVRLRSVNDALQHHRAMQSVKAFVWKELNTSVIAPSISRAQFVKAARAAVDEVRASNPQLGPWKYWAIIVGGSRGRGKASRRSIEKTVRSNMTTSLEAGLRGWSKMCSSQNVSDIWEMVPREEQRQAADNFAQRTLEKLKDNQWPTDVDALSALRLWAFDKNSDRLNVIPDGESWVHSDTLGALPERRTGKLIISQASLGHTHFQRLLVLWVRGRMPPRFRKQALPHTTISVNKAYAARLHRDKNNLGPSVGIAVGKFSGGGLRYWPGDSKTVGLDELRAQKARSVLLDLRRSGPCVFDGTRGHEVQPFRGERFSLVLFTVRRHEKAGRTIRQAVEATGADWPSENSLRSLSERLPAPVGKGASGS